MTAAERAMHLAVIGKLAAYFLAFCCGAAFTLILGAL